MLQVARFLSPRHSLSLLRIWTSAKGPQRTKDESEHHWAGSQAR